MRTYRTTAAVAVGALVLVLGGCTPAGPGTPGPGAGSPSSAPSASAPPPASASPPGTTPSGSAPPAATPTAARQQLLLVTRSGGYAGRRSTLDIGEDGAWTLRDASDRPLRTGRLTGAGLDALRGALQQADFAHLPPAATGQGKVFDGFTYSFVHDGHQVVATDGSVPPALRKVLDALPSFETP
ncbi:hypothetical protein ABZY31_27330 [Streptomyces sp. NPDC006529]|uniref:hypothetical protein n=1 Tax=Streptomyces sp. NPDC006529 TaxID=3157177 RepID=UPI0033AAF781